MARPSPTQGPTLRGLETDARGMVRVFCTQSRQWVSRYPVDAREMVNAGTGTFDTPVVDKEADASKAAAQRAIDESPKTPAGTDPDENDPVIDFNVYQLPELRAFAKEAGIEKFEAMKKPELVEKLALAGFKPPAKA